MNYVNMSLTSALGLKAIPLCVNKTGKVTVKVHLSQPFEPEVTQVSGMFHLHQVTLAGCCAFFLCEWKWDQLAVC